MAIATATMSNDVNDNNNNVDDHNSNSNSSCSKDEHEHDFVMPGFRFHPTEEEFVEFYLSPTVEGKRFIFELITFLDLYRYDPWELPALAAIGEKEWFFYVPRDRKYRHSDRPNRVATSGYWKATEADRMIRAENSRSIGLKKTLVFYSGKAPKGIRTSWIMSEYRLPHPETEHYRKAEISLCRVYKRAGVEDHPTLPLCLPKWPSASSRGQLSGKKFPRDAAQQAMERFQAFGGGGVLSQQLDFEKISETEGTSSSTSDVTTALGLSKQNVYRPMATICTTLRLPSGMEEEGMFLNQSTLGCSSLVPNCTTLLPAGSSSVSSNVVDDLLSLVSYQQATMNQQQCYSTDHHHHQQPQQQQSQFSNLPSQSQQLSLSVLPNSLPTAFPDRLWDWNPISAYNNPFK